MNPSFFFVCLRCDNTLYHASYTSTSSRFSDATCHFPPSTRPYQVARRLWDTGPVATGNSAGSELCSRKPFVLCAGKTPQGKLSVCVVSSHSTTSVATSTQLTPSPVPPQQHLPRPHQHVTPRRILTQTARSSHRVRPALTQLRNLTSTRHFAPPAKKSASFRTGLPASLPNDLKQSWSGVNWMGESLEGRDPGLRLMPEKQQEILKIAQKMPRKCWRRCPSSS